MPLHAQNKENTAIANFSRLVVICYGNFQINTQIFENMQKQFQNFIAMLR